MKPQTSSASRPAKRTRQSNRLNYDSLEKRQMLTTFIVDTTLDDASGISDGFLSLREAIVAANTNAAFGDAPAGVSNGDIIRFSSDIDRIEITEQFEITDDLFIQGGGNEAGRVTIAGDRSSSRLFHIDTSETVGLGRLHLTGGNATMGAGIYFEGGGTLVLTHTLLGGNVQAAKGAGIYQDGGRLNIAHSEFNFNSAFPPQDCNCGDGDGGAIYSESGIVNLLETRFQQNQVLNEGGALYLNNSRLNAVDTAFESFNYNGGASIEDRRGGAIVLEGSSSANIRGGTFDDNSATGDGGGIWMSSDSFVSLFKVDFTENSAKRGGAVFNDGGSLLIRDVNFQENVSGGDPDVESNGAALFLNGGSTWVSDSNFESNLSWTGSGGAIEIESGRLIVSNSDFTNNESRAISSGVVSSDGGALKVSGGAFVRISNSDLVGNQAGHRGGAIAISEGSRLMMHASTVEYGRAKGRNSGDGGGGIYSDQSDLHLTSTRITGNEAREGGGIFLNGGSVGLTSSHISHNQVDFHGGGIKSANGFVWLNQTRLNNNLAGRDTDRLGHGGAIHLSGPNGRLIAKGEGVNYRSGYRFIETSFSNNAADSGGAIWVGSGSSAFLDAHTSLTSNQANDGHGGGVYALGHLRTKRAEFSENSATGDGGGLYLAQSGSAQLYAMTSFDNNSAGRYGGGVYHAGYLISPDAQYSDNTAGEDGDSIFVAETGRGR